MKKLARELNWIYAFLLLSIIPACSPVFSDLQSARTLGKGQVEFTPYYTNTGKTSEYKGINHVGTNFGIGLNGAIDIRGKIDRNWVRDEENSSSTVIGIGPKFSLVPNRIAFFLPAGRGFGDGASNTWQMQPTLFFTQPIIAEKLEVTLSPKYLANLCSDCGGQFAANLGIQASKDFSKMAWRLEYGKIFSGGSIGQLSLGVSFVLSPKK